jgi:hypothetical protein
MRRDLDPGDLETYEEDLLDSADMQRKAWWEAIREQQSVEDHL